MRRKSSRKKRKNERGIVLFMAVCTVIAVAGVAMGYAMSSKHQSNETEVYIEQVTNFFIAEGALDHAIFEINKEGEGFDNYLASGLVFSSESFAGTTYKVEIVDNDDGDGDPTDDIDNIVYLKSSTTGDSITKGETARKIKTMATLADGIFDPKSALMVGGNLKISGSPVIQGTNGSAYANGDLWITGGATITQGVYATGNLDFSGTSYTVPADKQFEGCAPVPLPEINASDFKDKLLEQVAAGDDRYKIDYYFTSDGKVKDADGNILVNSFTTNGPNPTDWNGWKRDNQGRWKLTGDTLSATYYIEGEVKITGNAGTAETPLAITLIIAGVDGDPQHNSGNLSISGHPFLEPKVPDTLFICDRDLDIGGAAGQPSSYEGLLACHEQVDMSGTPDIKGVVLAEDAEDLSNNVSTNNYIDVTGNIELTYNGGLDLILEVPTNVKIISWEEEVKD